jgi:2-methylcitrate dehydratase PrpD
MDIGIKKYPCCYLQQRNIDGVLDLISEHHITWDEIESVEHEINHTVSLYLKYVQPETGEDSRFSLEHSTVACFFDDKVFLNSYTDDKARDPQFKEARKRVRVIVHPEWPGGYFAFDSPVTIRLKDGRTLSKLCVNARGDPTQRLTEDEVMQKYFDCVDFAGMLSRKSAEKAAEMLLRLDTLDELGPLMDIFAFPER